MANELYYDYITGYLDIFKKTIEEAKIEVLPKLTKEPWISPQKEIIKYIDSVILDSDIEKFSENMNYFLIVREEVLKNYTEKRIKQIKEQNPDLNLSRYVYVGSKIKSTGETFETYIEEDSYKKESTINHIINENRKLLLPEADETDIEITYTVNVAAFNSNIKNINSNNRTKKFVTLDNMTPLNSDYIIISRVKRSKRELEKFVDYLLGIRDEFHYDSIATHEIVPNGKILYDSVENIHTISDSIPFKAEYRPLGLLLPFYKKENINNIINEGNNIESILEARKKITQEDKNKLLAGIWIDHHFNKMRLETILQIPEFFKWYKGVLGHNSYYQKERERNRVENQKNMKFYIHKSKAEEQSIILNYNLNHVAKHLEERFSKVYDPNIL